MPPPTIQELYDRALRHHQAGQFTQAEALYGQILSLQADHPETLHHLGLLACQAGNLARGADLMAQAVRARPQFPEALSNLGVVLRDLGRCDEAIAACRQALALSPALSAAHNNLGNALRDKGLLNEAVAALRQAIALQPGFAEAYNNLGNVWRAMGLLDDAVAAFGQALALQPRQAGFHRNLGNALRAQGRIEEALAAFRRALTIQPGFAEAHSNILFSMLYHPDSDAAAIADEHRRWHQAHAVRLTDWIQPHTNDRSPERRLRIGYVSPDFRDHVVGRNLLPLFMHHDHRQFEVTCYMDVRAADHLTAEFRRLSDGSHLTTGLSDEALARQIREDRIDILVDLALHSGGGRPLLFARSLPPIQVTFAGYPGTTGLPTVDYRLSDPYLDPPDEASQESCYAEETLRLPATFWCYDPLDDHPPAVAPLPALASGYITFGCLNNFCKVSAPMLSLWARVLAEVPGSRLLLLAGPGSHRQRTVRLLADQGVTGDRVVFLDKGPRRAYLEAYGQIDIGLDTLPYNGHTTSLDSLFMGVPVVTLVGRTVVGRAGLSQLSNLGLSEFIGRTPEQFVAIARDVAGDLPRLAALRGGLRSRMQESPLMDGAAFSRGIEAAYRIMWRRWCGGGTAR